MDRALKERIIGAAVLVVFVVLVVPVFLDGPSQDDATTTERIPLPGQGEQSVKTVVLERDRAQPVPSTSTRVPEEPETAEETTSATPVATPDESPDDPEPEQASGETVSAEAPEPEPEQPAPQPVIQRTVTSSTGMWAVQLGSFSSEENANRLAADLRQQGFAAFLSQTSSAGKRLHRVRIGPQKDRQTAEAMAARLKSAGHTGQVVTHP